MATPALILFIPSLHVDLVHCDQCQGEIKDKARDREAHLPSQQNPFLCSLEKDQGRRLTDNLTPWFLDFIILGKLGLGQTANFS